MRIVLGVISLVVVLALVGMLAKTQLRAVATVAPRAAEGAASALPEQARQVQQRVHDDVTRALEQGAQRGPNPYE